MKQNIMLIEDDDEIRNMVTDYLSMEFSVFSFGDGKTAMQSAAGCGGYDLILLDLMLPDMSGMEIIKAVRKTSTIPIIIITAKDNDTDKSFGLNLGADDYVVKPFSLIELTARIKANIRRAATWQISGNTTAGPACGSPGGYPGDLQARETGRPPESSGSDFSPDSAPESALPGFTINGLEINPAGHTVRRQGTEIDLTPTEFEILYLLASHPGQAFSKKRLYEQIWKEPYLGSENVLNTHINRLRAKLKSGPEDTTVYIKTLWGIGYKMEETK